MTTRDYNKNQNNAVLVKQMKIGDKVMVIRTGETGVVTKIVEYNRNDGKWDSPYGYSSVQVLFEGLSRYKRIRHYSASSLKVI